MALLNIGADPNARNEAGRKPLEVVPKDSPLRGTAVYRRLREHTPTSQNEADAFMMLSRFLLDAGERPFREFVRHHVERQSATQIRRAAVAEASTLPKDLQPMVESYTDELNEQLLVRREFWQKSTCRDAVNTVLGLCNKHLGLSFELPVDVAKMSGVEQELALALFQIATLSFAYTAADQRAARKFMGIPPIFPWPSTISLLYPLVAGASAYHQATAAAHATPGLSALGYGLANLGYLLAASGLLFGRFGAFRLRSRRATVGAALAAFLMGRVILNVSL